MKFVLLTVSISLFIVAGYIFDNYPKASILVCVLGLFILAETLYRNGFYH